jgi:hypothetical protein
LSAVLVSGCLPATAQQPTATPAAAATATPEEASNPEKLPNPVRARDAALAFLNEHYPGQSPAAGARWTEENTTPEGIVGTSAFQYTANGWVITVSFPLVAPEATIYEVVVADPSTGFQWEGKVNATWQVTEQDPPSSGGQPVVGWLGHVASLPAKAQFDDYVILQPEGAGEIGLAGANEQVEAEIVALRGKEEPGKYAHFWGTLACDVPDYGGCQLIVTRLRYGPTLAKPEPVEGWEGTLVSNPSGAQFDDYFILAGDFPVGYGIASLDPAIQSDLENLCDTGIPFRVWGQIRCGTIDAFGSQIEVERIEIQEIPLAPSPEPEESEGEPVEGWTGTVVKLPPGSQHGDYFEREDGERFDIGTIDSAQDRQLAETRWTGAQVRVWGRLYTGVPATQARHIEVERLEIVSGPAEEPRNLSPFATPSASSTLPSDRWGTYHSASAIDGLLESAWVEGAEGSGPGEWIMLSFPGPIELHSIGLDVGFDRDADIFAKNNRLQKATVIFSTGEQVELEFSDMRGLQRIPLVRAPGPNIETTFVQVVIEDVYPGSQYDDTCLSEIEVWGTTK